MKLGIESDQSKSSNSTRTIIATGEAGGLALELDCLLLFVYNRGKANISPVLSTPPLTKRRFFLRTQGLKPAAVLFFGLNDG